MLSHKHKRKDAAGSTLAALYFCLSLGRIKLVGIVFINPDYFC